MNYILFDDQKVREDLLPLSFSRPIADIRFGITTIREKWETALKAKTSSLTEKYLSVKFPLIKDIENILINGSVYPSLKLVEKIINLKPNQALVGETKIIAMNLSLENLETMETSDTVEISYDEEVLCINNVWELFSKLDVLIPMDFQTLTAGRTSQVLSKSNFVHGNHPIFLEEGAIVEFAYLNATNGPIYIGRNTEIMEGAVIRGPFAIGDHSVVRAGAKIYGPTSIGPECKVGGEISNSLILGYSNKAHDGFLGNSVIGEWCNLGAGTNTSNLKNTYDSVRIWNYRQETFMDTGLQFCGLIMGDHSKSSINTMFNTGTVVGVSVNLFGAGFPRQFVSSFNWGGYSSGFKKYNINKAFTVAEKVFGRRSLIFDQIEKDILYSVYEMTL